MEKIGKLFILGCLLAIFDSLNCDAQWVIDMDSVSLGRIKIHSCDTLVLSDSIVDAMNRADSLCAIYGHISIMSEGDFIEPDVYYEYTIGKTVKVIKSSTIWHSKCERCGDDYYHKDPPIREVVFEAKK